VSPPPLVFLEKHSRCIHFDGKSAAIITPVGLQAILTENFMRVGLWDSFSPQSIQALVEINRHFNGWRKSVWKSITPEFRSCKKMLEHF
jgi:hypothetical protein